MDRAEGNVWEYSHITAVSASRSRKLCGIGTTGATNVESCENGLGI